MQPCYHLVFSLISLCVRPKTTPRLRKQVCFPFCSLSQLHNGVRRAVLPPSSFIYWRHKQSTPPEFLSSSISGLYCMWNMLILQSERERKWSAFIVFNILTSQTTPTVNSQQHSSVLSSTSISRLSCVCNIDELSENIPSIFLQQSTLSWYFCVEPKMKREDIVNWTNPFFMSIQFCTRVSTAVNSATKQSDILRRCSLCW